jgi:Transposase DDE domain
MLQVALGFAPAAWRLLVFSRMQAALHRVQGELAQVLDAARITGLCQELGYRFRRRLLDPVTTIHLFVLQILHGNFAIARLREFAECHFSEAAYCNARGRLPLALLQGLLERVGAALVPAMDDTGRWHGHRTFHVDGSSFSMPDTPELQQEFGQPGGQKPACGFPTAHLLTLFHAGTGFLRKIIAAPLRSHDMAHATLVHPELAAGDVLVGDRAFGSFAHFALLVQRGVQGVFRAHQRQIIDFRKGRPHQVPGTARRKGVPTSHWLKRLGVRDQLVEYVKPTQRPVWLSADAYAVLPATLVLRELRYRVTQRGSRVREVTLVTTLLDAERYPATELAELYHQRWQVETNLRHLKQTMGLDVLHCTTVNGVLKELTVFALVYNLVRAVMGAAAERQQVAVDRISFADALG